MKGWTKFGDSCRSIQRVFSVQAKHAYKFLSMKPSSLPEEEWEEHYHSAKAEILMKAIMTGSGNSLHDNLLLVNADHLYHRYPVCSSIREYMNQAKQKAGKSVNTVQEILHCINEDIKKLTKQKETLDEQQVVKKSELEKLEVEQASNKQSLDSYKDSLLQANEKLRSTRAELRRQEERLKKAKTVAWVGVGITAIPIFGWIAGPAMAVGGAVDACQAVDAIDEAERNVREFQSNVDHYENRVSKYNSKICQTEHSIKKVAKELVQIAEQTKALERQRKALTIFLQKIRKVL